MWIISPGARPLFAQFVAAGDTPKTAPISIPREVVASPDAKQLREISQDSLPRDD
jgi:hypothetical protein